MGSISPYEKREELRRVLQSRHFTKAKKKSRFLEFVCEQTFLGNGDKLNEYLIGVEIYERGPEFNPQEDAIVRVQAHEIRKSLKEYYENEGTDDPCRIDLPSGHYVPAFTKVADLETAPAHDGRDRPMSGIRRHGLVLGLSAACAILGILLVRERYFRSSTPSVRWATSISNDALWFWGPFLPPAAPPLIVVPNHPLLRAAHEGDSQALLAGSQLIPKEKLPGFRDTIHYRELKQFRFVPSTTDFTAVGECLGLLNFFELFASAEQTVHVKASRLVDFETIKSGNAILLGGNQPWSGRIFLYSEGFWFRAGVISNSSPRPDERSLYKPEFDPVTNSLRKDYALVLMLPNERREHRILLIYGIYTQGSQAAIEYVTSAERLQELRKELVALSPDKQSTPRYFQALLQTTVEDGVPGKASFVSARIIPDKSVTGM